MTGGVTARQARSPRTRGVHQPVRAVCARDSQAPLCTVDMLPAVAIASDFNPAGASGYQHETRHHRAVGVMSRPSPVLPRARDGAVPERQAPPPDAAAKLVLPHVRHPFHATDGMPPGPVERHVTGDPFHAATGGDPPFRFGAPAPGTGMPRVREIPSQSDHAAQLRVRADVTRRHGRFRGQVDRQAAPGTDTRRQGSGLGDDPRL